MRQELPNGDLPTLILAVLGQTPLHGYAIAREVERLSDQALKTREGSLYPALRVLEQDGDVDAVLTDYVMPGKNGADLIREIRQIRPDMPILLITGYADAAQDVPPDVARLAKPYRSAELIDAVNRLRALP